MLAIKSLFLFSVTIISFADISLAAPSPCQDQSCKIADASGSTGHSRSRYESYKGHLKSESPGGDKCIAAWWDSGFNVDSKRLRTRSMPSTEQFMKMVAEYPDQLSDDKVDHLVRQATAGMQCKPNILVFARGTVEMGGLGQLVGPNLARHMKSIMPGQWEFKGVPYHSTFGGDYCAGIPGGKIATKMLNKVVEDCPTSKIVVSGYSQGAMVVRIGVAFGTKAVRRNTVGVLVFGDPFSGANIAGYNSANIKTFCHNGDGVCGGALRITPTHLTYGKNAKEGAEWIKQRVSQAKIGEENLGPGKIVTASSRGESGSSPKSSGLSGLKGLGGKKLGGKKKSSASDDRRM